jgi:hypothetical protein
MVRRYSESRRKNKTLATRPVERGGRFIDVLLEREEKRPKEKPTLKWVGALKHLRDKYTSVELQHKILEWWIEDELDRH